MRVLLFPVFCCVFFVIVLFPSCKHDSMFNVEPDPTDTITPIDTTGNGGGGGNGVLCDPDSVYFGNQILPILISNCTQSGCHNDLDHEDGVILTSYQKMISTVEDAISTNLGENHLIRVLTDDDPEDRMPYNKPALPQAQIDLITRWIQQGAKNNSCNENAGQCDTANAKFGNFVQPLIQSRCQGCHSGSSPQGGISLANYTDIKAVADNGKLYTVVTRGVNWMPKGGQKLDDCTTAKLKAWIDAGAPNN